MSLISDGELRRLLVEREIEVGPINDSTRGLYQRKLRKLQEEERRVNRPKRQPAKIAAVTGVKRRRVEEEASNRGEKRLRFDLTEHSNLYPDLSEWVPPQDQYSPSEDSAGPSSYSSYSSSSLSPSTLYDSSPKKKPPISQFSPIAHHYGGDQPSSFSSERSLSSQSSEEYSSVSPSPSSLSPSSLSPLSQLPRISSSPSEGGFLKLFTKYIGAKVNNFFGKDSPASRKILSSESSDGEVSKRKKLFSDVPSGDGEVSKRKTLFSSSDGESSKQKKLTPSGDGEVSKQKRSFSGAFVDAVPLNTLSLRDEVAEATSEYTKERPSLPSMSKRYDWELNPNDVALCRKADSSLFRLGKGGFGEVFKGLRDSVDEVAVKIIRLHDSTPSAIDQFKAEIDLISKLRHRNIVQFYGACIQPTNLYMVTELMDTDLFSALRDHRIVERYKWSGIYGQEVLIGVASGLNYLHSRKPPVVHRDIKSPNILVMDSISKIADVGIARTMGASDMTAQKGFTMAWAAPEVVYRRRATEKIDIWSLGIVIWEVVTGKLPKPGKLFLPADSPQLLRSLYSRCINDDPVRRPSALELTSELRKIR